MKLLGLAKITVYEVSSQFLFSKTRNNYYCSQFPRSSQVTIFGSFKTEKSNRRLPQNV